jgi:hypothetical protein
MRSDVLRSEIKVVEADSAEGLTKKINEHLDQEWKILLSSYTVAFDQGQKSYTTLMTKERYYADPEILEEAHDAPSALDKYSS